ncbi:TlpA disulfide reductase family protein [Catenovulum adriaticum]|uniref:TlpA family protein disulfide reductase n=1 Tax=Catenovulum adriaticum TaxID=2984846 RepID=A0ABY7ANK0_9ALTE|nr:TlpA disulfide reductase family protein [Catenovulum sp. TS8]WAJ70030.1 TlpA family protein disulfide reductase [Catenovulum sp. TS8]
MKSILSIFVLLVGLITPAVAEPAPDFKINDKTSLSDLKGKVVYVDFWASWCAPCRKSFPWLNELQTQYKEKGFTVIAVNVDVEKSMADEFLEQVPANFPIVYDPNSKIAKAYQLVGMPSSYIIGRDGEVKHMHAGFSSKKTAQYQQEIIELIKQ